jgi:hypothetical protein
MSTPLLKEVPARPKALVETPVPPIPDVDESKSDVASVQYSHYRTRLSRHRTGLSEHRTYSPNTGPTFRCIEPICPPSAPRCRCAGQECRSSARA